MSENTITWKHGNIKTIARILNDNGNINNITYQTTPNSVVFLSDGFFLACFEYYLKSKN